MALQLYLLYKVVRWPRMASDSTAQKTGSGLRSMFLPSIKGTLNHLIIKVETPDYELSQVFCFLYAVRIITLKKTHP